MVETLQLDPDRPLIICDADEVLLQFIVGLENYLARQGFRLDLASFRIHGNVRHASTNEVAADDRVTQLIAEFFAAETLHLEPVAGASEALQNLSNRAQIVILSNLPASSRQARMENLTRHGMAYPVIAGSGPKGTIVQSIIKDVVAPIVFIDDLPPHHASVASVSPHVHRLHFVADPRLARLIGASRDAHARIDNWSDAEAWISSRIVGG